MPNLSDRLFSPFIGHEATLAAFAARMRDLGLTPDDVPLLYEEWMAERKRDMVPAPEPAPTPETDRGDTRRRPGQADAEHRLGACPECGGEVWGIKKCPHISPPWRTFFACDNDDCKYHGRSRFDVGELRRKWPEGAEAE